MRNTEKALIARIRGVAEICREEGVACLANGDVQDYNDALRIMKEYQVDGAMIARGAELNPSCFRREGPLPSIDIAKLFVEKVLDHLIFTIFLYIYANCRHWKSTIILRTPSIV
jgi:tRNA-dihydrouridine synthase 2